MDQSQYWEQFYRRSGPPRVPSQFAAFSLAEMPPRADIVEFGCGNGRDALFFARYGHRVIGIDKAREAVETGRERAAQELLPAHFICCGISDLPQKAEFLLKLRAPLILYSRFFLHSIDEAEEEAFLAFCRSCLSRHSGRLFVEFRTDKDETRYKSQSEEHFRRYIRAGDFAARAEAAGFAIDYQLEGCGLAKYGREDAFVARFILSLKPAENTELG